MNESDLIFQAMIESNCDCNSDLPDHSIYYSFIFLIPMFITFSMYSIGFKYTS